MRLGPRSGSIRTRVLCVQDRVLIDQEIGPSCARFASDDAHRDAETHAKPALGDDEPLHHADVGARSLERLAHRAVRGRPMRRSVPETEIELAEWI